MRNLLLYLIILVIAPLGFGMWLLIDKAEAKHKHLEKEYQNKFCEFIEGYEEYVLPNKRRIDCLERSYAIEVDFAYKIFEGIGQAEYYAYMTNRKPRLLLIIEKDNDLNTVREFHSYLLDYKKLDYYIIYSIDDYFYIIKPETVEDIPNSLKNIKTGVLLNASK